MRQEAQAIVFAAGPGSRMTAVGVKSKSLLPIGNFPMVYYPLKFLENNGFEEATVLVNQKEEKEFRKINEAYGLKIKLDFVPVDTSNDPGTTDSLRLIENKVKKNVDEVLLVSADLITSFSLMSMLDFHRSRGAALTALFSDQNKEYSKSVPPGPKVKPNLSNDVICYEEDSKRLVYAVSAGDYDDKVIIPTKAAQTITESITVASNLLDAHLYIVKRGVLDYILSKECAGMGSLKAEIIPHIINEQFRKMNHGDSDEEKGLGKYMNLARYEDLICSYNTSLIPSKFQSNSPVDGRSCYLYHDKSFCVRINTIPAFWQINKKFSDIHEMLGITGNQQKNDNGNPQICNMTLVGKGAEVSQKTNIVKSVIGENCRIADKIRISNSVIFNAVSIAEGCVIENSLICVSIKKRCQIKNSIVTFALKIEEGGTYENELLESGLSQEYSY